MKTARAGAPGLRQQTQYTCMATSMASALQALGKEVTEVEVNRVMKCGPLRGASWEDLLATAQYFGARATLVVPATVEMLRNWTEQGIPVIIAWNPEGRPWSHASVVVDVDAQNRVHIMDPNIPNPSETFRVIDADEFCKKWMEPVGDSLLVRRPACCIEREITAEGRQVRASTKVATSFIKDWLRQAPGADPKDLEKLDRTARKGPGISRDLKKTLTDVAYDEGYWGNGILGWLFNLGKVLRVDVSREYKFGARAGRKDGERTATVNLFASRSKTAGMGAPPFARFRVELDAIRKRIRTPKDTRSLDLAVEILPVYVQGGVRTGLLPKSFTRKYNKMVRGMGVMVLSGDLDVLKARCNTILDAMDEASQRLERSSKRAARSPNQSGSAAMIKRQGLTPVDVMYGQAMPHRRPLIMPGDGIQDRNGKLWLFVGTDAHGGAILARNERELKQKTREIVQDRNHHTTATAGTSASRVATRHLKRNPHA